MYLPRASPITLDAIDEAAKRIEAEKTECACDGLRSRSPRVHRDGAAPDASVGEASVT